jgi:hypothetical protein
MDPLVFPFLGLEIFKLVTGVENCKRMVGKHWQLNSKSGTLPIAIWYTSE